MALREKHKNHTCNMILVLIIHWEIKFGRKYTWILILLTLWVVTFEIITFSPFF